MFLLGFSYVYSVVLRSQTFILRLIEDYFDALLACVIHTSTGVKTNEKGKIHTLRFLFYNPEFLTFIFNCISNFYLRLIMDSFIAVCITCTRKVLKNSPMSCKENVSRAQCNTARLNKTKFDGFMGQRLGFFLCFGSNDPMEQVIM